MNIKEEALRRASPPASSPTSAEGPSALSGNTFGRVREHALSRALSGSVRRIRTEFGRSEEHRWIERYGFVEHTIGKAKRPP